MTLTSTLTGCRPSAAGEGLCSRFSTPLGRNKILGPIDIPRQALIEDDAYLETESLGFGFVAGERRWTVGKDESTMRRNDDDVGAIAMAVRHQSHVVIFGEPLEFFCVRKIGMRNDHGVDIKVREISDTFVDGAIETASRFPEDARSVSSRPSGDFGVVTHNPNIEGRSCGDYSRCH